MCIFTLLGFVVVHLKFFEFCFEFVVLHNFFLAFFVKDLILLFEFVYFLLQYSYLLLLLCLTGLLFLDIFFFVFLDGGFERLNLFVILNEFLVKFLILSLKFFGLISGICKFWLNCEYLFLGFLKIESLEILELKDMFFLFVDLES